MGRKPKTEGEGNSKDTRLSNVDLYSCLSSADVRKLTKLAGKYGVSEEALIGVAIQALLEGRVEVATRNTVYLAPIE